MNHQYKKQLTLLRKRIPVGLQHGLKLLEKTNGDVTQAVEIFEEEMLIVVQHKTGAGRYQALEHLIKNNYNIGFTLKSIDEEQFSLTQRIFKRYKHNLEEALEKVAQAVEETEKLKRNFWLDLERLEILDPPRFCLISLMEWLTYEDWEGFDAAIYFHSDVVTEQMVSQLLLPGIATTIRYAKAIHLQQLEEQDSKLRRAGAISATPEFAEQEELYQKQRPLLIETLYVYVERNMEKFP